MNNKIEIALRKHIKRIKKDIAERDPNSAWDKEKNKIDYKTFSIENNLSMLSINVKVTKA